MKGLIRRLTLSALAALMLFMVPGALALATTYEDFSTWTETDTLGYISKTSTRVTYTNAQDSATTENVTGAQSALIAASQDFYTDFTYKMTGSSLNTGSAGVYIGYSDNVGTGDWYNSLIVINFAAFNKSDLYLREYSSGSGYSSTPVINPVVNTVYYMRLSRVSGNATTRAYLDVYTDAAHNTLFATTNLTLHSTPKYTHPLTGVSTESPGLTTISAYYENLTVPTLTSGTSTPGTDYVVAGTVTNLSASSANLTYSLQNMTTNATYKGIKIDTTSHAIDNAYYWTENQSGNWGNGSYYDAPSFLTAGTTYYWKAYAVISGTEYYSNEQSFKLRWEPVITTYPAILSGTTIIANSYISDTGAGTENVTSFGYLIGPNSGNYTDSYVVNVNLNTGATGLFFEPNFTASTYYITAIAWNGYYTGLSNEVTVSANQTVDTSALNLSLTATLYPQNETMVAFTGYYNRNAGFPISQAQFSYGLTSNATGNIVNISQGGMMLTSPVGGVAENLTATTTYYAKFGVYIDGNYYWSSVIQFTTGAAPVSTAANPEIMTLAASNIGVTSFTANGRIVATNNVTVGAQGFDFKNKYGAIIPFLSNDAAPYAAGNYTAVFSELEAGSTAEYRFHVVGNRDVVGAWVSVTLSNPAGGIDNTSVGPHRDASVWVVMWARALGMDNTFGHWGFVFMWMIGTALILGPFIVALAFKGQKLAAQVLALILAIAEIVIFGAFLFTGWLGVWPIVILIFGVVASVFILIGAMLNRRGAA